MKAQATPRWKSISRSLRIYHGEAAKERSIAMDALYGVFINPGDLAFDIGSHVGDRISSFRRLGAKVVALEPQPLPARVLRLIHGRDPDVTLVEAACGDHEGTITFRINSANPTVSTASTDFVKAADGAGGWEGQVWDEERIVSLTTMDALITRYGIPAFAKIDVEGFEASVLAGLSQKIPALSFEFTTIQRDVAYDCLKRLAHLGFAKFNIAMGESQLFVQDEFISMDAMASLIRDLPHEANSGDVYARA
ncbi:MAG: FkbM family methyltransferase [Beijerinckiaceae bacterium]